MASAVVCLLLLLMRTVWCSSCNGRSETGMQSASSNCRYDTELIEVEALIQTELQLQQPVAFRGIHPFEHMAYCIKHY